MNDYPTATAEVNLSALVHNYLLFKSHLQRLDPKAWLACVVKADAYGHGLRPCVRALAEAGATRFAVACLDEARAVREVSPGAQILILGSTPPERAPELARLGCIQTVHSLEYGQALSAAAAGTLEVHCKLDTAMGRLGLSVDEEDPEAGIRDVLALASLPRLALRGVYSHFCAADEPASPRTERQLARFARIKERLAAHGAEVCYHLCNSAGLVRFGAAGYDGARLGLSLYGVPPSDALTLPGLRQVMQCGCPIVQIKTVRRGQSVGYGATFTAPRDLRVGVLPMGYADGLLRACQGGTVLVGGREAEIVGRVSMDQATIALPDDLPVSVGDMAVLYDYDGVNLPRLSRHAGTIPYELLVLLGRRVKRVYVRD
ncbi:MAG: alanine racemase [Eubacteriales bacterium]